MLVGVNTVGSPMEFAVGNPFTAAGVGLDPTVWDFGSVTPAGRTTVRRSTGPVCVVGPLGAGAGSVVSGRGSGSGVDTGGRALVPGGPGRRS